MFNGLNESDNLGFYYEVADLLFDAVPNSLCILHPFPEHLTRMAFQGSFTEKPLSRYLRDSGGLFRQFLRFMIEARWMMSALAPRETYWLPAGASLMSPSDASPGLGRSDTHVLSAAIFEDFTRLFSSSLSRDQTKHSKDPVTAEGVLDAVSALRSLAGVTPIVTHEAPSASEPERPSIHVLGYSLGGFMAQSVFFTWPFLVSSCTSLFSGGPLRDVSPVAFANPEEWQTVLHSLRYELDESLMDPNRLGGIVPEGNELELAHVAGIDYGLFRFFVRVFYEVFEQSYGGSYSTRVSEFGRRMFFVVGGSDPIVKPQHVQKVAPLEGVNMLEIANLTHFIGTKGKDVEEREQRGFWLPQAVTVIGSFARRTEDVHAEAVSSQWLDETFTRVAGKRQDLLEPQDDWDRVVTGGDGALASPIFEQSLDHICQRVGKEQGVLYIARNQVPTMFLPAEEVRRRASFLHHADDRIMRYTEGIARRLELLQRHKNTMVIVPADWPGPLSSETVHVSNQSETPGSQLPHLLSIEQVIETARLHLASVGAFEFVPGQVAAPDLLLNALKQHRHIARPWITTLPDVWFFFSLTAIKRLFRSELGVDEVLTELPELLSRTFDAEKRFAERGSGQTELNEMLSVGEVRLIKVSGAKYNPRYRGQAIADMRGALEALSHLVFARELSKPLEIVEHTLA